MGSGEASLADSEMTMSEPLDETYLTWLYTKVGLDKELGPRFTRWSLLRQLHKTEFVWFVPNDDNRVEDGRDLRYEFLDEFSITWVDEFWMRLGCSVLEMLVALSRRLSFEAEGEPSDWFWKMIDNLGLAGLTDHRYHLPHIPKQVEDVVNQLIFRTYEFDGSGGGLFPLKFPDKDQRQVEIWYQLSAYLLETN